tara:strand:+ start:2436 stop:3719 length:1284 start_codon:yes stop_codon:yes gene_type:complete
MSSDRSRKLEWNSAKRPKIVNSLSAPSPNEGNNGDIQLRQTKIGAKIFVKLGGTWHSTFLSSETDQGKMNSANTLSVDEINLKGKITLSSKGTQNVCMGTGNKDIGENNVVIGVDAGNSLESGANDNTIIGLEAGKALTTGDSNVFLGVEAGLDITTGSDNTIVGHEAIASRSTPASSTNRIVIGKGAEGVANNTCTIGNYAVTDVYLSENIHIGDQGTEKGRLHCGEINVYPANGVGQDTEINMWQSVDNNGDDDTSDAGDYQRIAWSLRTDNSSGTSGSTPNFYILDYITGTTRLRILNSNGDFYTNDGTVHSISDIRIKKDITDLSDGLNIINQLRPRTFKYNGKADMTLDDGITRYGFIADEVLTIAPQYVDANLKEEIDGVEVNDFKSLSTIKMIPMMVKSIQELSAKIDAMQVEINNLKNS